MSSNVIGYISLAIAIVLETIGTSALKESQQFSKVIPTAITLVCYIAAFYLLSITLKTMPVGIAYAIWSGVGIVLISGIGYFAFKQHLDLAACAGIVLIVAGVLVINLFSKSIGH